MHAVAYKSPQSAKKEREGYFVMLWLPVKQYFFYFFFLYLETRLLLCFLALLRNLRFLTGNAAHWMATSPEATSSIP